MGTTYKKLRVESDGKIIIERTYTSITEKEKEEILNELQVKLEFVIYEITVAKTKEAQIKTQIAEVGNIKAEVSSTK